MAKDLKHIEQIIEQMRQIKTNITALEERYDLLKERVIEALADDNEGFIDGKPVVTYKQTVSRRFDQTWLKTNMPDVYEQGRKETISIRFTLVEEQPDGA